MKFFVILSSLLIFLVILSGCTDTVTPNISDVNYFADVNYSLEEDTNVLDNNIVKPPVNFDFNNFSIDMDTCVRACKVDMNNSIICSKNCLDELTSGIERTQFLKLFSPCLNVCRKNGGEQYACMSTCRRTPLSPMEKCLQACIIVEKNSPLCAENCKENLFSYVLDSNMPQDTNPEKSDTNIPLTVDQNE